MYASGMHADVCFDLKVQGYISVCQQESVHKLKYQS